jgi:hypothetical protein
MLWLSIGNLIKPAFAVGAGFADNLTFIVKLSAKPAPTLIRYLICDLKHSVFFGESGKSI